MRTLTKTLLASAALAAALAPSAFADSQVAAAPGARNLAGAGGYLAWASPTGTGRWKLTVRAPDGTISQPAIPDFTQAPSPKLGSSAQYGTAKRLVAVYTRAGDVYSLDLATGAESRLARLSTSATETLVAVNQGRYVVVRKDGAGKGVWAYGPSGKGKRLTATVPAQIAMSQSRVASIEGTGSGRKVVIRRLSGRARPMVAGKGLVAPSSLWLTRYRAGWATSNPQVGTRLYGTKRFAGSGGPFTLQVVRSPWTSTSPLFGIALDRSEPAFYLDAQGVQRFDPTPFHGV
jgi:hypothetical protein